MHEVNLFVDVGLHVVDELGLAEHVLLFVNNVGLERLKEHLLRLVAVVTNHLDFLFKDELVKGAHNVHTKLLGLCEQEV